jgi:membrane-bound serine protease (ClpP class)
MLRILAAFVLTILVAGLSAFAAEAGAAKPAATPEAAKPIPTAPATAPTAAPATAPATVPTALPTRTKSAVLITWTDEIEPVRARYFKRTVEDAIKRKVDVIVLNLTTPGGRVDTTWEMVNLLLAIPKDGPKTAVFIPDHATSGGALLSYSHDYIYLSSRASIGDSGVIMIKQDGGMEYAPEKGETVVRTLLRNLAQNKGWNEAKLVKMTARNQELWRVDLAGGPVWVIEDDLPRFLNDHPDLQRKGEALIRDGERVGFVVLPKDRLLNYTAKEAVAEGMATGMAENLDEVYAKLGVDQTRIIDLAPTSVETVSWVLAGWAPMLAGLAVLFLILEFKMPSGLWITLAAVCGAAFFVCQYYQEMAGYPELLLVLLGVACVIVDIFVLPTGGGLATAGLFLGVIGLVMAFMPNDIKFHPGAEGWGRDLGVALVNSVFALAMVAVGVVVAIATLPRLRAINRIAVTAEIAGTSAGATEVGSAKLAGRRGKTRTPLRPGGAVIVDGNDLGAVTEHGEFIEADAEIEVVVVRYGEAVVRAVQPPTPTEPAKPEGQA